MQGQPGNPSLQVSEIFYSLQGESSRIGLPTVFVRLTGCPLRCVWCDTEHAFTGGRRMALSAILKEVGAFDTPRVCVTGGEPLAQKNCLLLLAALCVSGYDVSLETSGAFRWQVPRPRQNAEGGRRWRIPLGRSSPASRRRRQS